MFYDFSFKVNYRSIFILNNLIDLKLTTNFFYLNNFKVIDFYNFIILDYFTGFFNFIVEIYLNYLNFPIFILFAVLFFLSSFFSLIALSYLGFYGVFVLNFITLFLL
jgi:hypothetical protein